MLVDTIKAVWNAGGTAQKTQWQTSLLFNTFGVEIIEIPFLRLHWPEGKSLGYVALFIIKVEM